MNHIEEMESLIMPAIDLNYKLVPTSELNHSHVGKVCTVFLEDMICHERISGVNIHHDGSALVKFYSGERKLFNLGQEIGIHS